MWLWSSEVTTNSDSLWFPFPPTSFKSMFQPFFTPRLLQWRRSQTPSADILSLIHEAYSTYRVGWGGGDSITDLDPRGMNNPMLKPTDCEINDTFTGCDPCSLAVMPGSSELTSEACTIMQPPPPISQYCASHPCHILEACLHSLQETDWAANKSNDSCLQKWEMLYYLIENVIMDFHLSIIQIKQTTLWEDLI